MTSSKQHGAEAAPGSQTGVTRRQVLRGAGGLVALAAIGTATAGSIASASGGDDLRSRLTIIAPAAAGGGWDTVAREMQQSQRANGIVNNTQVLNMPGAGGTIALNNLSNLAGEPTNLMVSGTGMLAATIQFNSETTFADVTPLAVIIEEYSVIVVPQNSPYQSLPELVDAWKASPQTTPWSGGGSFDQLVVTELAVQSEVDPSSIIYVSSDGGGETIQALLNGTVKAAASGYPDAKDQIESGSLRALALVAPQRLPTADIPTTVEQGSDVTLTNWRLILAPGGITEEEKAAMLEVVEETIATEEWQVAKARYDWMERIITGPELDTFLAEETTQISGLYEELGL